MAEKLKAFSMFDGVGGFVVGLNDANKSLGKNTFETLYTNQYEPSRKVQDAFEVGVYNFPEINHSNEDVMKTSDDYFKEKVDLIIENNTEDTEKLKNSVKEIIKKLT